MVTRCLAMFGVWWGVALGAEGEAGGLPDTRIEVVLTLRTADPDEATARLARMAEVSGGWLALSTDEEVVLRVPPEALPIVDAAAGGVGVVTHRVETRREQEDARTTLEAKRTAARATLDQTMALLARSIEHGLYRVRRHVLERVEELESLDGSHRALIRTIAFPTVRIRLAAPAPMPSSQAYGSAFNWARILTEASRMSGDVVWSRLRGVRWRRVPDGFARFSGMRRDIALAGDGTALSAVTWRGLPAKDVAFWWEVLERQLRHEGHEVAGVQPVRAAGRDGVVAWGEDPEARVHWRVAVLADGRRVHTMVAHAPEDAAGLLQGRMQQALAALR